MIVQYNKDAGVALAFPMMEVQVALQILRALHQACNEDFILKAIAEIENDLKPKQLPHKNYFHICRNCVTEMDERDPNAYLMTTKSLNGEQDSYWVHYVCKELKNDRPD